MPTGRLTYLWAAESVLRKHGRPLRASEIITFAQNDGLFSNEMNSQTPQKSLQARISMDIVRRKENSPFIRTARGRFWLREFLDKSPHQHGEYFPVSFSTIRPYQAPPRAPSQPKENVLVIPKKHYEKLLNFQGFRPDNGKLVRRLIAGNPSYLPRTTAENAADFKQVVTYVIVTHGSKVLAFKRGMFSRAAEFLRGSSCIGFGGHVAESDRDLFSISDAGITENALRELQEEIAVERHLTDADRNSIKIVGIINDDSSEVGRRHVAIVMQYEITGWEAWEAPERGEASVNQIKWIDVNSELINLSEYEYWSQLCWREFFPQVSQSQPAFKILKKAPFKGSHILVVAGGIGSGKSSVTKHFVNHLGYSEINSGKVLAKLMGIRPVPQTSRNNFQEVAGKFIAAPARVQRFANALTRAAKKTGCDRVIIDGIRHRATLAAIRAKSEIPVAVLFVHASADLAYRFYSKREHRGRHKLKAQDFMALLNGASELDVPNLIADADAVLYNWSGQADLGEALFEMAASLRLQPRKKKKHG